MSQPSENEETRRWNQRQFHLEESHTTTSGTRTTFIEHITPGTAVPPHWHTRFSETFDLISGAMTVYDCDKPDVDLLERSGKQLEVGKKVTVPPGRYHKYVVGEGGAVLRAIVEPADQDFERLLMVLNGLRADGELGGLGDSLELMAVIMGLSDAHLFGPMAGMLEGVRREKATEIEELRGRLVGKYDTREQLEALMGKGQ